MVSPSGSISRSTSALVSAFVSFVRFCSVESFRVPPKGRLKNAWQFSRPFGTHAAEGGSRRLKRRAIVGNPSGTKTFESYTRSKTVMRFVTIWNGQNRILRIGCLQRFGEGEEKSDRPHPGPLLQERENGSPSREKPATGFCPTTLP